MKRFHVHVSVDKLDDSIRFYSSLFGTAPTVVQPEYAQWMLDDPRVNFAISQRGRQPGVNHLGFQVEDDAALQAMRGQLEAADAGVLSAWTKIFISIMTLILTDMLRTELLLAETSTTRIRL